MSCLRTGGPGKEHGANKPSPTERVRERSKGDTTCLTTSQNPSLQHPSWMNKACTTRKDSESEWLAKDNPETNPITIKPDFEPRSRTVLLGSLTLLLSTRVPFPNKISALLAHVSPRTIHFQVLDKSSVSGPGRGPPSCNKINKIGNEKGEVTTDSAEIQRIIRDYFEQLYGNKWITWKKWTDC